MKPSTKVPVTPELKAKLNELSRLFYKEQGFNVRKGFNFAEATHPQEMAIYRKAKMTYEFWMDVELEEDDD